MLILISLIILINLIQTNAQNSEDTKQANNLSTCEDQGADCTIFTNFCTNQYYNDFMKEHCPRSCGYCATNGTGLLQFKSNNNAENKKQQETGSLYSQTLCSDSIQDIGFCENTGTTIEVKRTLCARTCQLCQPYIIVSSNSSGAVIVAKELTDKNVTTLTSPVPILNIKEDTKNAILQSIIGSSNNNNNDNDNYNNNNNNQRNSETIPQRGSTLCVDRESPRLCSELVNKCDDEAYFEFLNYYCPVSCNLCGDKNGESRQQIRRGRLGANRLNSVAIRRQIGGPRNRQAVASICEDRFEKCKELMNDEICENQSGRYLCRATCSYCRRSDNILNDNVVAPNTSPLRAPIDALQDERGVNFVRERIIRPRPQQITSRRRGRNGLRPLVVLPRITEEKPVSNSVILISGKNAGKRAIVVEEDSGDSAEVSSDASANESESKVSSNEDPAQDIRRHLVAAESSNANRFNRRETFGKKTRFTRRKDQLQSLPKSQSLNLESEPISNEFSNTNEEGSAPNFNDNDKNAETNEINGSSGAIDTEEAENDNINNGLDSIEGNREVQSSNANSDYSIENSGTSNDKPPSIEDDFVPKERTNRRSIDRLSNNDKKKLTRRKGKRAERTGNDESLNSSNLNFEQKRKEKQRKNLENLRGQKNNTRADRGKQRTARQPINEKSGIKGNNITNERLKTKTNENQNNLNENREKANKQRVDGQRRKKAKKVFILPERTDRRYIIREEILNHQGQGNLPKISTQKSDEQNSLDSFDNQTSNSFNNSNSSTQEELDFRTGSQDISGNTIDKNESLSNGTKFDLSNSQVENNEEAENSSLGTSSVETTTPIKTKFTYSQKIRDFFQKLQNDGTNEAILKKLQGKVDERLRENNESIINGEADNETENSNQTQTISDASNPNNENNNSSQKSSIESNGEKNLNKDQTEIRRKRQIGLSQFQSSNESNEKLQNQIVVEQPSALRSDEQYSDFISPLLLSNKPWQHVSTNATN